MHKCIHFEEAKHFFRSFYIWFKIVNNMHWDITELCPFENGWVNFIVLKANFKAIKWYILINYINFEIQLYFLRMLSFKKIQNGEKKLTGSELNKIKYQIKWPKIHQKITFSSFCIKQRHAKNRNSFCYQI